MLKISTRDPFWSTRKGEGKESKSNVEKEKDLKARYLAREDEPSNEEQIPRFRKSRRLFFVFHCFYRFWEGQRIIVLPSCSSNYENNGTQKAGWAVRVHKTFCVFYFFCSLISSASRSRKLVSWEIRRQQKTVISSKVAKRMQVFDQRASPSLRKPWVGHRTRSCHQDKLPWVGYWVGPGCQIRSMRGFGSFR